MSMKKICFACGPTIVDTYIAAVDPTQSLQPLGEGLGARNGCRIFSSKVHQDADTPHTVALLCPGHERPCNRRGPDKRNELPPPHCTLTFHDDAPRGYQMSLMPLRQLLRRNGVHGARSVEGHKRECRPCPGPASCSTNNGRSCVPAAMEWSGVRISRCASSSDRT